MIATRFLDSITRFQPINGTIDTDRGTTPTRIFKSIMISESSNRRGRRSLASLVKFHQFQAICRGHAVPHSGEGAARGLLRLDGLRRLRLPVEQRARSLLRLHSHTVIVVCSWNYMSSTEVLALKHESRILGHWYDHVSGARISQASYPWAKQHIV